MHEFNHESLQSNYLKVFAKGLLAGVLIAIAAFTYLMLWGFAKANNQSSLLNHFLQAVCFCIGIILIVALDASLFTGKIGYLFDRKKSYSLELLVIYLANALGAIVTTILFYSTTMPNKAVGNSLLIKDLVQTMLKSKVNFTFSGMLNTFLGAIGTGILIHAGFMGYKHAKHKILAILALLFSIWTFILVGFDHCLASFSFFAFGIGYNYLHVTIFILVVTLGNSLGSILLQFLLKSIDKEKFQCQY